MVQNANDASRKDFKLFDFLERKTEVLRRFRSVFRRVIGVVVSAAVDEALGYIDGGSALVAAAFHDAQHAYVQHRLEALHVVQALKVVTLDGQPIVAVDATVANAHLVRAEEHVHQRVQTRYAAQVDLRLASAAARLHANVAHLFRKG